MNSNDFLDIDQQSSKIDDSLTVDKSLTTRISRYLLYLFYN